VLARELFVEADHLVLRDVIVGGQEQNRWRPAQRVHRLHRPAVGHDERVDVQKPSGRDETCKVAAVREPEEKAFARSRALLRRFESGRPSVDERGAGAGVVLVARPAVPRRELGGGARAEPTAQREHGVAA
jgi:hypothetical protein